MKQSKDPFEAAFEEQEDSPPESPADASFDTQNPNSSDAAAHHPQPQPPHDHLHDDDNPKKAAPQFTPTSGAGPITTTGAGAGTGTGTSTKNKDEDDEEEEENMDVELGKFPSSGDPDKMAKMQLVWNFSFNSLIKKILFFFFFFLVSLLPGYLFLSLPLFSFYFFRINYFLISTENISLGVLVVQGYIVTVHRGTDEQIRVLPEGWISES